VDLAKREDGVSVLKVASRKLGADNIGRPRYDRLVADDAPRYEQPHRAYEMASTHACEGPRLRPYRRPAVPYAPDPDAPVPIRPYTLPPEMAALKAEAMATYTPPRDWRTEDGVCGAGSFYLVEEKDPRTGWITAHWFCKRHKDHADRVTEQVRAQNEQAPEPIPNTGGLLPCYFKADWEKVYRHYRPHWTAPSYGLAAEDWPTAEEAPMRAYGRLRAIGSLSLDEET
jgi:hypothetical protein